MDQGRHRWRTARHRNGARAHGTSLAKARDGGQHSWTRSRTRRGFLAAVPRTGPRLPRSRTHTRSGRGSGRPGARLPGLLLERSRRAGRSGHRRSCGRRGRRRGWPRCGGGGQSDRRSAYWNENSSAPLLPAGSTYLDYRPAYRYGWESAAKPEYRGRRLAKRGRAREGWDDVKGKLLARVAGHETGGA